MKNLKHYYDEIRLRGVKNVAARAGYFARLATGRLRRLPAQEMTGAEYLAQALRPGTVETAEEYIALRKAAPRPWRGIPADIVTGPLAVAADSAVARHFRFAGGDYFFHDQVNWHHCLSTDTAFPRGHWTHIPFRTLRAKCDVKPSRAMSRHAFFVSLALMWHKSGEEKYPRAFTELLNGWCDQNTPETGIHYSSGTELGLRCLAWMLADRLFGDCALYDPKTRMRLHCNLYAQARHIAEFLPLTRRHARDYRVICEAASLALAALNYPEWAQSGKWLEQGLEVLGDELPRQVMAGGLHFETSYGYHLLVTEILLMLLCALRRAKKPAPGGIPELLEKMGAPLADSRQPDGDLPNINDNENAYAMPLQLDTRDRLQGLFAATAALRAVPGFKAAAGEAWGAFPHLLLGEEGAEDFRLMASYAAAPPTSAAFPGNGVFILRGGSDFALLKNTPDPFPPSGHNHADLLHVLLFMNGRPVLADAGTYRYAGDRGMRDALRGTMAHNTVTVDKKPQAEPGLPFGWSAPLEAGETKFFDGGPHAFVDATHDAYAPLGVTHRRALVRLKSENLWIVIDRMEGGDAHYFEQFWHFAPGLEIEELGEGHFQVAQGEDNAAYLRFPRGGDHDSFESFLGSAVAKWSYVSPRYGDITPAATLRHGWTATLSPETASHRIAIFSASVDGIPFAEHGPGVFGIAGWRIDMTAFPLRLEKEK